jgi:site-specific recombinase XerD
VDLGPVGVDSRLVGVNSQSAHMKEILVPLKEMAIEIMQEFLRNNRHEGIESLSQVERIIFVRDGVSEGQLNEVRNSCYN